jgi:hypothetical protein
LPLAPEALPYTPLVPAAVTISVLLSPLVKLPPTLPPRPPVTLPPTLPVTLLVTLPVTLLVILQRTLPVILLVMP